jgi:hypothetical protein
MVQWRYGKLPRFGVFTYPDATCSVDVTLARTLGWVTSSYWSSTLLGQFFTLKWLLQPLSLLKNLFPYLLVAAVVGGILGYVAASAPVAAILGTALGVFGGAAVGIVTAAFRKDKLALHLETRFTGVLPDQTRALLPALEDEFDEVLLISPATEWREHSSSHSWPANPDVPVLVVVHKDDHYYWVAAHALGSWKKGAGESIFMSLLESDPRAHMRRAIGDKDTPLTDDELRALSFWYPPPM